MRGRGKNVEIWAKKSPKQPEIWLKTGRNFRNFGAFCPKLRENFLAALSKSQFANQNKQMKTKIFRDWK